MIRQVKKRERGIALLMVLGLLALVGSVVADFQFSSHVDYALAVNSRDEVQAEYNALSAMRFRAVILKQGRKIQTALGPILKDLPIGQLLEMLPVECGLMSAITKQKGGDAATGEDFFPGECMATSASEHGKISLNVLANPNPMVRQQVQTLLLGVLANPKLEKHFQKDDRSGSHAQNPLELVGAIQDWVDLDKTDANNAASDEDRHYENLKDHYRAKNAPFDSVAELQLVHGIDDELYALLKDHVTMYNDGSQIELPTAPMERIVLGLFASVRDDRVAVGLDPAALSKLLLRIVEMRQLGAMGFSVLTMARFQELINEVNLGGVVDTAKVQRVFTDKTGTTWYTIDALGRLGNATRRMRGVFQATEGRFYYVRIE